MSLFDFSTIGLTVSCLAIVVRSSLIDATGNSRAGLMDNLSDPPPRITATTSKNLSAKRAQTRIQAFLNDFENRNSTLNGGDKAVTAQLQKLNQALLEERQRQKAAGEGR